MSKNYFELDNKAKKALSDKHGKPDAFASDSVITVAETTTIAPQVVEEEEAAPTQD